LNYVKELVTGLRSLPPVSDRVFWRDVEWLVRQGLPDAGTSGRRWPPRRDVAQGVI